MLGDWLAIEEILENLVSNAIKYGAGKPILVSVTADAAKGVAALASRMAGQAFRPRVGRAFSNASSAPCRRTIMRAVSAWDCGS